MNVLSPTSPAAARSFFDALAASIEAIPNVLRFEGTPPTHKESIASFTAKPAGAYVDETDDDRPGTDPDIPANQTTDDGTDL